jgi:hypothetical protein
MSRRRGDSSARTFGQEMYGSLQRPKDGHMSRTIPSGMLILQEPRHSNHLFWAEADYEVGHCGGCDYEVTLQAEYHFHDDYDWHKGLAAGGPIVGVTGFKDKWARALHDHGLAQEFKIDGYWFDQPKVKVYTFSPDWLTSGVPSSPISVAPGRP